MNSSPLGREAFWFFTREIFKLQLHRSAVIWQSGCSESAASGVEPFCFVFILTRWPSHPETRSPPGPPRATARQLDGSRVWLLMAGLYLSGPNWSADCWAFWLRNAIKIDVSCFQVFFSRRDSSFNQLIITQMMYSWGFILTSFTIIGVVWLFFFRMSLDKMNQKNNILIMFWCCSREAPPPKKKSFNCSALICILPKKVNIFNYRRHLSVYMRHLSVTCELRRQFLILNIVRRATC